MSKRKKHKKRSARSGARTPSFGSNEKQEDLIQTVEALTRAVSNGEIPTVRRLVDHLQANHPEHYRTYSFRAQLAWWDGNRDEAVRLSREAVRRGGEKVRAVVSHHAEILQSAGLHEEALEVLDNQAAEWSDDIKLIRIRFQALIGLHRRAEARKFLEDQIAAGTEIPTPLLNDLGMLLFDLGDKEGAMGQLRTALEKDPGYN
ncbi:MAG: tetratricopeptide repeat protein, partial [Thiohalospira sp.]